MWNKELIEMTAQTDKNIAFKNQIQIHEKHSLEEIALAHD